MNKRLAKPGNGSLNPPVDNPPAKLSQDITYDWSPELVKTCTRRFILRASRRTQSALLLLLALGIFCIAKGAPVGWVMIAFGLVPVFIWLRGYQRSVKLAESRSDREVTVRVDPESMTFRTSEKESTLKWSQIKEAWISPDVLMLFPQGTRQYIALPVASIGEDLKQYIETNIRQNGGKVA